VADAIARIGENPDAKILAGGHSLIPAMKLRLAQPGELVDISGVESLKGIEVTGDGATIGALTTYNELRDHAELVAAYPVLPSIISVIGDQQVRARGTIGGCLAHNDPAADLTALFLALGGSVTATGPNGDRTIDASDLFVDLWTTSLEPDELITSVHLPPFPEGTGMAYEKYANPASGYAVVGVAAVITVTGGSIATASVTLTGAVSTPIHAVATEAALVGKPATEETIAAATSQVTDGIDINGDHFASVEFRAHLTQVYARRAIGRAAGLS
jgi:carbon-monoxide dehydrogenase medium subunit